MSHLNMAFFLPFFIHLLWMDVYANEEVVGIGISPTPNFTTPKTADERNWEEVEHEKALEEKRKEMRKSLNVSLDRFLTGLPSWGDGRWCQKIVEDNLDWWERKRLEDWTFDEEKFKIIDAGKDERGLVENGGGCSRLRQLFPFNEEPLSAEERQFPLAYGLLVHKSSFQVLAMISAIYQPQNVYCLVVDDKAEEQFKMEMLLLADCFSNIFVMGSVGKIEWCKFGVTRAVYTCFRFLVELRHDWEYYQYLSGVDLPLKTNLEMVRILKSLKGTVNMEVTRQDPKKLPKGIKPPLPMWKSSLSALISRQAANAMIKSEKVQQLMQYLQHAECSDESIWATIAGNPKELAIPGGFDANAFFEANANCNKLLTIGNKKSTSNGTSIVTAGGEPFHPSNYYISRYQVWEKSKRDTCKGKLVKESCVFGIGDLPILLKRPELIAHKIYLDYQPAAYFCLWKTIHERALDWRNQQKFQSSAYSNLPTVRMALKNDGDVKDPFLHSCHMSLLT